MFFSLSQPFNHIHTLTKHTIIILNNYFEYINYKYISHLIPSHKFNVKAQIKCKVFPSYWANVYSLNDNNNNCQNSYSDVITELTEAGCSSEVIQFTHIDSTW